MGLRPWEQHSCTELLYAPSIPTVALALGDADDNVNYDVELGYYSGDLSSDMTLTDPLETTTTLWGGL